MNRNSMPKLSRLYVILPCHSLEDFPIHHVGDEAANVLANWTALWHPVLIAACGRKPDWQRADYGDFRFELAEDETCVAVLPTISEHSLNSDLTERLEKHQAIFIEGLSDRNEIVRHAVASFPDANKKLESVDQEIAEDFHALGYAYLQTQIMTRQLRYSSNLDEERFGEVVLAAANAAISGDEDTTKSMLTRCFDLLLEEKNGYYPVEPELLDVVLTAETTLGPSFATQLKKSHDQNVLLTGKVAQRLSEKYPDHADILKTRIADQKVTLIGGLYDELPANLVATETTLNQIHEGRKTLSKLFDSEPSVFMRRRFGLNPALPGLLDQLDFVGCVHATLDDGSFPRGTSSNMRWTGDDDHSILAFGELPLSAEEPGAFLGLGVKIGEAIDSAHVSSLLFVHWPNKTCQAFEDVIRATRYGPLFGTFMSFDAYYDSVYDPGYGDTFTTDEYRNPFLKQAVERSQSNPISRHTKYWKRFYKLQSCRSLLTQTCARTSIDSQSAIDLQNRIAQLSSSAEAALNLTDDDAGIDSAIDELENEIKSCWSAHSAGKASRDNHACTQLINTTSTKRRSIITTQDKTVGSLKHEAPVVYAEGSSENGTTWVVELPAIGAGHISSEQIANRADLKKDPPPLEERILRNEFFQLEVDESTGGIRSIQLYGSRTNLCGQQIAMRIPATRDARNQPLTKAHYSKMVADEITSSSTQIFGEIVSKGTLRDGDEKVASFKQSIRVTRGVRIADVSIEVEPLKALRHTQNHYICSRLAWKDESSRVYANSLESKYDVTSDWFHATNYFEVIQDDHRITMLTEGLPYHRRTSRRMLDSILIVGEEQERRFHFGLGVDVPYAMSAAVNRLTPLIEISTENDVAGERTSWLFHLNCKNVLATHWEPLFEPASPNDATPDKWTGVSIRLRETEGRSGQLTVSCPNPARSAERTSLAGDFISSLDVDQEDRSKVQVDFGRFEFLQIKIHWKP